MKFILDNPRPVQLEAVDFVKKAVESGYRDIVIQAPTGSGKSAIGVTLSLMFGKDGGYYLVTEKALAQQILDDNFNTTLNEIKSSSNYKCKGGYSNCQIGQQAKKPHNCQQYNACPYKIAFSQFMKAKVGLTNYSYSILALKNEIIPPRNIAIFDEAHNLEEELINAYVVKINRKELNDMGLNHIKYPDTDSDEEMIKWIRKTYVKALDNQLKLLEGNLEEAKDNDENTQKIEKELIKVQTTIKQVGELLFYYSPDTYVFLINDANPVQLEYEFKLLSAATVADGYLTTIAGVRVYMSAYMGTKDVFCKSLGLDPKKTAWLNLPHPFKPENREFHRLPILDLSYKNLQVNSKKAYSDMVKAVKEILDKHPNEKGLIHCQSYKFGEILEKALLNEKHIILFPRSAGERKEKYDYHLNNKKPTVIITPSMQEGYDFKGDAARFQIILKVPYPDMKDPYVKARMAKDKDWYPFQVAKAIVQMAGRPCRNEEDWGITYMIDGAYEQWHTYNKRLLPNWFLETEVEYE